MKTQMIGLLYHSDTRPFDRPFERINQKMAGKFLPARTNDEKFYRRMQTLIIYKQAKFKIPLPSKFNERERERERERKGERKTDCAISLSRGGPGGASGPNREM